MKKKYSVLVVDDAFFIRNLIKRAIGNKPSTDYPYEFEIAGEGLNGEEGLLLYKGLKPDIVTVDVNMGSLGGVQFIKKLQAFDKEAQVIVISSSLDDKLKSEIEKLGCYYIQKPFQEAYLWTKLDTIAEYLMNKPKKTVKAVPKEVVKPVVKPVPKEVVKENIKKTSSETNLNKNIPNKEQVNVVENKPKMEKQNTNKVQPVDNKNKNQQKNNKPKKHHLDDEISVVDVVPKELIKNNKEKTNNINNKVNNNKPKNNQKNPKVNNKVKNEKPKNTFDDFVVDEGLSINAMRNQLNKSNNNPVNKTNKTEPIKKALMDFEVVEEIPTIKPKINKVDTVEKVKKENTTKNNSVNSSPLIDESVIEYIKKPIVLENKEANKPIIKDAISMEEDLIINDLDVDKQEELDNETLIVDVVKSDNDFIIDKNISPNKDELFIIDEEITIEDEELSIVDEKTDLDVLSDKVELSDTNEDDLMIVEDEELSIVDEETDLDIVDEEFELSNSDEDDLMIIEDDELSIVEEESLTINEDNNELSIINENEEFSIIDEDVLLVEDKSITDDDMELSIVEDDELSIKDDVEIEDSYKEDLNVIENSILEEDNMLTENVQYEGHYEDEDLNIEEDIFEEDNSVIVDEQVDIVEEVKEVTIEDTLLSNISYNIEELLSEYKEDVAEVGNSHQISILADITKEIEIDRKYALNLPNQQETSVENKTEAKSIEEELDIEDDGFIPSDDNDDDFDFDDFKDIEFSLDTGTNIEEVSMEDNNMYNQADNAPKKELNQYDYNYNKVNNEDNRYSQSGGVRIAPPKDSRLKEIYSAKMEKDYNIVFDDNKQEEPAEETKKKGLFSKLFNKKSKK